MWLTPYDVSVMREELAEADKKTNKHDTKQAVCSTKIFHLKRIRR